MRLVSSTGREGPKDFPKCQHFAYNTFLFHSCVQKLHLYKASIELVQCFAVMEQQKTGQTPSRFYNSSYMLLLHCVWFDIFELLFIPNQLFCN